MLCRFPVEILRVGSGAITRWAAMKELPIANLAADPAVPTILVVEDEGSSGCDGRSALEIVSDLVDR